jgi:ADP-heptose:LPS heptosyltransferase
VIWAFGDEILATGLARGAKDRCKRIAFGDGKKIIYSPWSEQIFRYNPNIAKPGQERADDLEWVFHYKGNRLYNSVGPGRSKWIWNGKFRPVPGELFFSDDELKFADKFKKGFVLIEPNVPWHKSVSANKDWGASKYQAVAQELANSGWLVVQFSYPTMLTRLRAASLIVTPTFRHALALMARAALYIGPEGGLHHGSAAVGIPAVVLFGGFIPPSVTGYDTHTNLTGGATACGKLHTCRHCRDAMDAISVDKVLNCANRYLRSDEAA